MLAIFVMTLSWLRSGASPAPGRTMPSADLSDRLTVSLITCWPGSEVYELCGHEALRIRGEGIDSVWNYGVFDFNQKDFIYRFVKGETDYMLVGYPFSWFMPEYIGKGRRVVEQDLNLTPEETVRLRRLLQRESLPDSCRYRYNYVKDNCATRILMRLDQAAGSRILYDDSIHYGTFRQEMRHYHANYPWYQFGIDLALGSGLDYPLRGREEMFVPMEMMRKADGAKFADGRPLVKATRVLNAGVEDATLGPTPVWLTPMTVSVSIAVLVIILVVFDFIRRRLTRWAYSLFYFVIGLTGCVSFFLVFFSSHEATSPNTLIVWLNPLQLVPAICLWWRHTRPLAVAVACYDIVAVACMLIVWPFQHQSANPAVFPMAVATLLMSISLIRLRSADNFKFKGQLPSSPARKRSASGQKRYKRK
ncbi:MAG: DUF4105 domain-containing protein [Bacteroidales bacterium]|nr:DUF4105 domain-containing protein [Bacteroidales bacterium]